MTFLKPCCRSWPGSAKSRKLIKSLKCPIHIATKLKLHFDFCGQTMKIKHRFADFCLSDFYQPHICRATFAYQTSTDQDFCPSDFCHSRLLPIFRATKKTRLLLIRHITGQLNHFQIFLLVKTKKGQSQISRPIENIEKIKSLLCETGNFYLK